MTTLRRFWIEFDPQERSDYLLGRGVGVSGVDVRDCLSMVADLVPDRPLPPVCRITADISLAEPLPMSRRHLGVSVWRGVWFPPVNLATGPTLPIDRRGAPDNYPTPVTQSPPRRASETLRTTATWWDEIPHIHGLMWPLVEIHHSEYGRAMRQSAPVLRDVCAADSTYGQLVREALDFMIAWHPTPDEWFDPTQTRFADQRDLDEYLRAFRDYLFENRPEPIYPPGSEPLSPEDAVREALSRVVINRPGANEAPGSERLPPAAQP